MIVKTNLEEVNPSGRLDVLAYKGVRQLAKHIEEKNGLVGIWDVVKPHVNDAIVKHMGEVDIPTEAKVLLAILQANYKGIEGK